MEDNNCKRPFIKIYIWVLWTSGFIPKVKGDYEIVLEILIKQEIYKHPILPSHF
jgi:hypothetical protein